MGKVLHQEEPRKAWPTWALVSLFVAAILTTGVVLNFAGTARHREMWNDISYKKDTRTLKPICFALWERSALIVPCEDIPDSLLKP
jgi:hypothetical protein